MVEFFTLLQHEKFVLLGSKVASKQSKEGIMFILFFFSTLFCRKSYSWLSVMMQFSVYIFFQVGSNSSTCHALIVMYGIECVKSDFVSECMDASKGL